uniref:Capsid protein n=1 Tax=Atrato Sobemo-like virus 2 TaxID=2689348 RepID=A0A6B9KPA9_9VIRU|nr:putative coat protein [Atrato Sobemo-like virus 2]
MAKQSTTAKLQQQLAAVVRRLDKLDLSKPPRQRQQQPRRRRRRASRGVPRVRPGCVSGPGEIVMARTELLTTVKLAASSATANGSVDIVPSSFSFMKNLFSSFERIRWDSLHFYWKPAVGTVYGGLFSMGVDWDLSSQATTREAISGYTPNASMACFADSQKTPMVLPPSRLQSRLWYTPNQGDKTDKGPCSLVWAVSGTEGPTAATLGEIWATYTVVMSGTHA